MKIKQHERYIKSFPYYKVQFWDGYVSAWHDIQQRFATEELARQWIKGQEGILKLRIMRIHRTFREVI